VDLAKIAIKLRLRSAWEGIDLGFMLAREWFLPLWLLWLASALPIVILLILLPLPLWLAGLLQWWFKPLYEPPLLHWLGRRLFGERPTWRELRRAWPRAVLPQLLSNLTWRRFHPARSFVMPVNVLEQLRGKARSQRIQVLNRKSNAAVWLTIIGIHFEFVFELGVFFLVMMLIPEELLWTTWQDYLMQPDEISMWFQHVNALLAMSLIAPFYVAGGFALYLTRRSELEGWDIELGLRRMAARHSGKGAAWVGALALCALLAWGAPVAPLQAAEVDRQRVQATMAEVLADEAFGRMEEISRWELKARPDEIETRDNPFIKWLRGMSKGFAVFGELLLWLAAGALLAYLIYWFLNNRQWNPAKFGASRNGRAVATQIAGLDLRPESLPDDPAAEAERLIGAGDYRSAISLLYRGALSALIHHHALEISDGATEGECRLTVARQLERNLAQCFADLTGVWLQLAYAHRLPERERALALCQAWRGCFGGVANV
jgi:hypothetical protein